MGEQCSNKGEKDWGETGKGELGKALKLTKRDWRTVSGLKKEKWVLRGKMLKSIKITEN